MNAELKKEIEKMSREVSPSVFLHIASFFSTPTSYSFAASLALGVSVPEGALKETLAKARKEALTTLKLFGADLLIIDANYKKRRWGEWKEVTQEDGRVFGMTVRLAPPGSLPLSADFMILDPPSEDACLNVGGQEESELIKALKKISDERMGK